MDCSHIDKKHIYILSICIYSQEFQSSQIQRSQELHFKCFLDTSQTVAFCPTLRKRTEQYLQPNSDIVLAKIFCGLIGLFVALFSGISKGFNFVTSGHRSTIRNLKPASTTNTVKPC